MNIYSEFLIKMQMHQLCELRDDSFGAHSVCTGGALCRHTTQHNSLVFLI